jgi:ankyrin repeat protein
VRECLYNTTLKHEWKKALGWAAVHGNEDLARATVRLLGSDNCHGYFTHDDPLILAVEAGHTAIVKMLLEHNPSMIHSKHWFDATVAGEGFKEHIEILNLFLNVPAPIPEKIHDIQPDHEESQLRYNRTVLDLALFHGKEEIVRILLADGRFALGPWSLESITSGNNETLVRLCLREAPPRYARDNMLPLCSAARSGNAAIVKLLLEESDKDPRRPAKYGQTPLHCAASASKVSAAIIKLHLKTKDVDPDAKDMGEAPPLPIAAKLGNL